MGAVAADVVDGRRDRVTGECARGGGGAMREWIRSMSPRSGSSRAVQFCKYLWFAYGQKRVNPNCLPLFAFGFPIRLALRNG